MTEDEILKTLSEMIAYVVGANSEKAKISVDDYQRYTNNVEQRHETILAAFRELQAERDALRKAMEEAVRILPGRYAVPSWADWIHAMDIMLKALGAEAKP